MTAKEFLSRYRSAHREAQDIELRMTQLRLKYAAPSAIRYSDMPTAHDSNHDLSDYAARMDELEEMLIEKYTRCIGIEIDIHTRLDKMDNQTEREVLRYRYIDGLTWEQIAERIGYTRRNATRIHGNALQHFSMEDVL